jgi:hypothetical protein
LEKKVIVGRQRDFLMFGLGAVLFFALGWYLQSGWTREPVEIKPAPVVQDMEQNEVLAEQERDQGRSIADFRLERDREQSRQRERLQEMLVAAGAGSDWSKQLEKDLLSLEKRVNYEHELENLLSARGYPNVAVSVNEASVTIVMKGKTLAPEQVGLIGQWTADVTGYPIDQIRIVDQL